MQNIEKIYDEYSQQVYKYLFCLTRNEHIAEELTQETLYIATINLEKLQYKYKINTKTNNNIDTRPIK